MKKMPSFDGIFWGRRQEACGAHRMFRVFVHVYIHHFDRILELSTLKAEAHGNTLFRHFYFFVKEFQLIEDKELEPLKELIERICK